MPAGLLPLFPAQLQTPCSSEYLAKVKLPRSNAGLSKGGVQAGTIRLESFQTFLWVSWASASGINGQFAGDCSPEKETDIESLIEEREKGKQNQVGG